MTRIITIDCKHGEVTNERKDLLLYSLFAYLQPNLNSTEEKARKLLVRPDLLVGFRQILYVVLLYIHATSRQNFGSYEASLSPHPNTPLLPKKRAIH